MALTFTQVDGAELGQFGRFTVTVYDVTLDTDYPTAGWPITPGEVGLGAIIFGAHPIAHRGASAAAATTGYVFMFDAVDGKLQAFDTGAAQAAPLDETTAGDNDLDGRVVRLMFYGV